MEFLSAFLYKIFFAGITLFAVLSAVSSAGSETLPGNEALLPRYISSSDTLVKINVTDEFCFEAWHVQGLLVTEKYFYFTSVDKPNLAAWLFKLDRTTGKPVAQKNLAKAFDIHPSGIDFDGKYIWVAIAAYSPNSHTYMKIVDPETLKNKTVFEVDDHIGAVARDGDTVIGANWNAEEFYFWNTGGELIEKKESPTGIGYQDCKGVNGFLMCTGGGYVDWVEIGSWKLVKRFEAGQSELGSPLSREGVAFYNKEIFFLPDDGPEARIYEYGFNGGASDSTEN